MGWGTYFYTWKYFSKETFNDKSDVEERLEETKQVITKIEGEIKAFVMMTEPQKFMPEEEDDPLWWLSDRIRELLEELDEFYCKRYDYEMILDRWEECHDKESGLAIPHPDEESLHSYMDGDYIATTKRNSPDDIS